MTDPSLDPNPSGPSPTVATEATVVGTVSLPQSPAEPAADQPAVTTPEPTGAAPAEPAATEATPQPDPAAGLEATTAGVRSNLNAIEQIALFWGGETGTKIRNHVGRLRELLAL